MTRMPTSLASSHLEVESFPQFPPRQSTPKLFTAKPLLTRLDAKTLFIAIDAVDDFPFEMNWWFLKNCSFRNVFSFLNCIFPQVTLLVYFNSQGRLICVSFHASIVWPFCLFHSCLGSVLGPSSVLHLLLWDRRLSTFNLLRTPYWSLASKKIWHWNQPISKSNTFKNRP